MSRNVTSIPSVTNVVPQRTSNITGEALQAIGGATQQISTNILEQEQRTKIIQASSQAQLELTRASNEFRVKYESDPFNKEGLAELEEKRKGILAAAGEGINPMFSREWLNTSLQLEASNKTQIEAWAFPQSQRNAEINLQNSYKNYINQATIDGEDFGLSPSLEIDGIINFANAQNKIAENAVGQLGEQTTREFLNDFGQDWTKSFLSGVAKTNPVKALRLMDLEEIKNSITDQKSFATFRESIENKALNFQETARKQEILNFLKNENSLLSSNEVLSYADIMRSSSGMSEEAKDYFLKANGFKPPSEQKLTTDQKFLNKAELYDAIASTGKQDELNVDQVAQLQRKIYENLKNGSLTDKEGTVMLRELLEPAIAKKEQELDKYSGTDFNPFNNDVGFEQIQKFFEEKLEIKPDKEAGEKKIGELSRMTNARKKVELYDLYFEQLQQQAASYRTQEYPDGLKISQLADLPRTTANKIYETAQQEALKTYNTVSSPAAAAQPQIPLSAIRKLREHPEKAADFDALFGVGAARRVLGQ